MKKEPPFFFIYLINCWSSVVVSVVLLVFWYFLWNTKIRHNDFALIYLIKSVSFHTASGQITSLQEKNGTKFCTQSWLKHLQKENFSFFLILLLPNGHGHYPENS